MQVKIEEEWVELNIGDRIYWRVEDSSPESGPTGDFYVESGIVTGFDGDDPIAEYWGGEETIRQGWLCKEPPPEDE